MLFLIGFLLAVSRAEERSPVAFAHKTDKPVVIDGVLDEECWRQALKTGYFLEIYDNTKPSQPQTYFQVVYDDEKLYFGITGEEPDISRLVKKSYPRDAWPSGSSFEIFLDMNNDRETYYQFAANPAGSIYDARRNDASWDGRWEVAVNVGSDRWTIEAAVPFADFGTGVPPAGDIWGLNICRNREGELKYSSTWAPVGGDFHNPGKFNTLVFGSFKDWLEKETRNYQKSRNEFLLFLNSIQPGDERLEAKARKSDQAMEMISRRRMPADAKINDIIPVYHEVISVKVLCHDLSDEIKVMKALNQLKETSK